MLKNIVLSGGSVKSISFIGALQALYERNMLQDVTRYICSSGGSIIGVLMTMGFSPATILENILKVVDIYEQLDVDVEAVLGIVENFGIENGDFFINWIKTKVRETFKIPEMTDLTFLEFAKLTGKDLVICASDIIDRKSVFFSLDKTPTTSVFEAIRASMAIPLIMVPVRIDDALYVDAALFNNFPMNFFDTLNKENICCVSTCGFCIVQSVDTHIPKIQQIENLNIVSYMSLILGTMVDRCNLPTKVTKNENDTHIVKICIDDDPNKFMSFDMTTFKFVMDKDLFSKYHKIGYDATIQQLDI